MELLEDKLAGGKNIDMKEVLLGLSNDEAGIAVKIDEMAGNTNITAYCVLTAFFYESPLTALKVIYSSILSRGKNKQMPEEFAKKMYFSQKKLRDIRAQRNIPGSLDGLRDTIELYVPHRQNSGRQSRGKY